MNDFNEANYQIIQDETVINKDIKLYCIISLLHDEAISKNKALELCQETGLFSEHWCVIDAKVTEIWPKYFKL